MGIAEPGPVTRRWRATGSSVNGSLDYEIVVEAALETTAREELRQYVVEYVRTNYGVTPRGVPWLVDPRTIKTEEVKR